MLNKAHTSLTFFILVLGMLASASVAMAYQEATSELLLPYFEVDLSGAGPSTFFSVVNASESAVEVVINVHSNWGVKILRSSVVLAGNEARAVDLSDWLIRGKLPERQLGEAELKHCQAALSGQRAPGNDLYYADEIEYGQAVGYVTLQTRTGAKVLFGDYFLVDAIQGAAQGEQLIDIASSSVSQGLCKRHGLRFMAGGSFDEGTEVVIWTSQINTASEDPYFPEHRKARASFSAYKQGGGLIEESNLGFVPLQVLKISDLNLDASFGWLNLSTDAPSFVTVRHSARQRFSVGLQTSCLPSPPAPVPTVLIPTGLVEAPAIDVELSANGLDDDAGPGPEMEPGEAVSWIYEVTNTGDVVLIDITVTNDKRGLICKRLSLAPGQSTTCQDTTFADAGQYGTLATATATSARGTEVVDHDRGHYYCPH